jgi:hypothetical protein
VGFGFTRHYGQSRPHRREGPNSQISANNGTEPDATPAFSDQPAGCVPEHFKSMGHASCTAVEGVSIVHSFWHWQSRGHYFHTNSHALEAESHFGHPD